MAGLDLLRWLRQQCAEYAYDLQGVLRVRRTKIGWPLVAKNPEDLEEKLRAGGHVLPLPKEPAALANVLEVSIVDFLTERIEATDGELIARRGGERFYPDLEITGPAVEGRYYAVDIKIARRGVTKKERPTNKTQSRITLYTGNTYFKYPDVKWAGTFRPFGDYAQHLDVVGLYTFRPNSPERVEDLELIVHEAWRIGSRQRSSTTREYVGAVQGLDDLREGRGEFDSEEEFYRYWRAYKFRVGETVAKRLEKVLREQRAR